MEGERDISEQSLQKEKRREGRRRLERRSCKGVRGNRPQGCEASDPHPCASNQLFHHPWLDPSIFEFAALNFIVVQDNEILMYVSL